MQNRVSVWSDMFFDKTPEEAVTIFKECGMDCFELSVEIGGQLYRRGQKEGMAKVGKEYARYLADNNFSAPQGHLEFIGGDICSANPQSFIDTLKGWIELYQNIGVKRMVLHSGGFDKTLTHDELMERRVTAINELLKPLNGTDFILCLENLIRIINTSEELKETIEALNSKNIGVCYDTGHLNLSKKVFRHYESEEHFFANVGQYIKATHIHDNDGTFDEHLIPNIIYNTDKWPSDPKYINLFLITKLLKKYNYDGLFNFECIGEAYAPDNIRKTKTVLMRQMGEFFTTLY